MVTLEFDFGEPIKTPKKRKHRATSKAAHDSVKEHKAEMYSKIIAGLEKLRVGGNFEEIAAASGIKPEQAWKRLSELVDNGTCFNVGITRPTSSGRQAMVRQLTKLKENTNYGFKIKNTTRTR